MGVSHHGNPDSFLCECVCGFGVSASSRQTSFRRPHSSGPYKWLNWPEHPAQVVDMVGDLVCLP